MGATYYFNLDVSGGDKSGDSEANAFDGSTTVTLPDGSSNSCRLNNVVAALQSGDTLWVKKSTSDITFHASNTTTSANDGPTNFVDGGTSYGKTEVYGYGGSTGDGIRATVNLGGKTWHWKEVLVVLKLNFMEHIIIRELSKRMIMLLFRTVESNTLPLLLKVT